jgi:hypothetical protein
VAGNEIDYSYDGIRTAGTKLHGVGSDTTTAKSRFRMANVTPASLGGTPGAAAFAEQHAASQARFEQVLDGITADIDDYARRLKASADLAEETDLGAQGAMRKFIATADNVDARGADSDYVKAHGRELAATPEEQRLLDDARQSGDVTTVATSQQQPVTERAANEGF